MIAVRSSFSVTPPTLFLAGGASGVVALPRIQRAGTQLAIPGSEAGRLFGKHGAMVYGRARKLLGAAADAEEATQEVFLRLMTAREAPPPENELVLWLCRVTTNYCLKKLRDQRRRGELLRQHGTDPDLPREGTADQLAEARALLSRADEQQAQAAAYVFIDGMSHDEAASVLGVSRRTVGNLIERFTQWAREQEEHPARSASEGRTH
jgi:RNA polymerase sigma-70 factor (ECF subfamily)